MDVDKHCLISVELKGKKMIIIAEISGEMPTIPGLWVVMAIASVPCLLGLINKWVALLLLFIAAVFSVGMAHCAYHQAFVEAGMKEAIWNEMGVFWVINSISSNFLPLFVAVGVLIWTIKKRNNTGEPTANTDDHDPIS